ncbi:serpin family protein, partial [Rhodoplanes serenus]|uniref:serpin family protein n=1 Tax=Rhodoplanes serenus TaxID=200615 RepID=UPI000DAE96A6
MSARVIAIPSACLSILVSVLVSALLLAGPAGPAAAQADPSATMPAAKPAGKPAPAARKKTADRPPGAPAAAKGVPAKRSSAGDAKSRAVKPATAAGAGAAGAAAATSATTDPAAMLAAQSRLAVRLVDALRKETPDAANLVVSPGSLAMVMALIDLGADDRLRAALARTLAFVDDAAAPPGTAADRKASAHKGDRTAASQTPPADLAAVRRLAQALRSDPAAAEVLSVADALWIDPAANPKEPTLAAVAAAGGTVFRERLGDPATLARINGWVGEKTRGLIPTILDRVPADAGLVAVNALAFKDRWRTAFAEARTRPAPFTRLDGSTVEVPLMTATFEAVPMRSDERFVAAELGYAHERFALVLLTSRDAPQPAAAFAPVAGWLSGDGFAAGPADVALPRLALAERAELLPALDALGLKAGRASPTALAGFAPGQRIAEVIQKTVLKIDESGTEAAAATAVVTVRSATRPSHPRLAFDKPFWFALRDKVTGLVLLAGYVGDAGRAVATAAASPEPPAVPPASAAPAA